MNKEKPVILSVDSLFEKEIYKIPIYQRNYTWKNMQINKLLEDIEKFTEENYYLGNMIVNKNKEGEFEVIDGQQRLTTLFILCQYLKVAKGRTLKFEARKKYNDTLANIENEEDGAKEIIKGYNIIKTYFRAKNSDQKKEFIEKLKKVKIVRVQVPEETDLNKYFEIMNTRGEQLELYEIAKARILKQLKEKDSRIAGAKIWEACQKMDTYLPMNFNYKTREKLFGPDWNSFEIKEFKDLKTKLKTDELETENKRTLEDMITNPDRKENEFQNEKEEEEEGKKEPFESILSFPNFILQVNAVVNGEKESLNDNDFIKTIEKNWETKERAEEFLVKLLKCRFYFDNYIIKRRSNENGDKEWSLKKLTNYKENGNKTPNYNQNTMDKQEENEQLKNLQACLRITYTSASAMDWVTKVLRKLDEDKNSNLIEELEKYCTEKIEKANFETASGFDIEWIIFSYLDYVLYRDNILDLNPNEKYSYLKEEIKNWQFNFRDSIEHFYPRTQMGNLPKWEKNYLNDFGNLALIATPDNAKFSNLPPEFKIQAHGQIAKQSLKLTIMKKLMEESQEGWNEKIVEQHGKEMKEILRKEIAKIK